MEQLFLINIELFARAGGGGSGGSSGGSGGGAGGGLAMIGFIPAYIIGSQLRKRLGREGIPFVAANIIGFSLVAATFVLIAKNWIGIIIALGAVAGMSTGLYELYNKIKQSKLVRDKLQRASAADPVWSESRLINHAKQIFLRYQKDWSKQNSKAVKAYTTEYYAYHAGLLIYTLQLMKRTNRMSNINISDVEVVDMLDSADDSQDTVTIGFSASAKDLLIDNSTGETLFTDNSQFTEYWRFRRHGNDWLLDGIDQATANPAMYNAQIDQFARQNNYCYSADMGWLFIPKRGQLFGGAQFGVSDINNHVVGLYNESLLVQLYTYQRANDVSSVVIAQINVPKEYGQIIVRRKKKLRFGGIRGLEKVEMEWGQFNKQYEVYASNTDQAVSFELLNPTYMEQLVALGFEVSIEVVDNVIYLYTEERGTDVAIYQTMYDLVQKAFKEMRL